MRVLPLDKALQPWIKRLLEWDLIQSAGRTQATRYFVDPALLRRLSFTGETTLKRIEQRGLKQSDLANVMPQSNLPAILAEKREISAALAGKPGRYFNVSAAMFIRS